VVATIAADRRASSTQAVRHQLGFSPIEVKGLAQRRMGARSHFVRTIRGLHINGRGMLTASASSTVVMDDYSATAVP